MVLDIKTFRQCFCFDSKSHASKNMWAKTIALLLVVSFGHASVLNWPAKVGSRVELDVADDIYGRKIVNWERTKDDDNIEKIKYCGSNKKEPICTQFVTKDNKPSKPITRAHVTKDGKLVIESVQKSDEAIYHSPDQKPVKGLAPPWIKLIVQ
ncbi:unnamed protein product [Cylicocyclus nassatus]|uniref:Uncharacterized protein n=1 Tax=Cylicocyclus nassatus TaxID=53992 RepID=A0AA36DKQ6_CYLNA|nr:unnamed protein product [Cylicocyclus nassatus]